MMAESDSLVSSSVSATSRRRCGVWGKRGRSLKTCIDASAASEIASRRARCGEFADQVPATALGGFAPPRGDLPLCTVWLWHIP